MNELDPKLNVPERLAWLCPSNPNQAEAQNLQNLKMEMLGSGRSFFDLSMINPDIPPPRFMIDKLLEATVKASNHRYSVSRGIKKLRQAFCSKYRERFHVLLDAEKQVCVTLGTKDALVNSLFVSCEPGSTVIMAEPAYPAHVAACQATGLKTAFFKQQQDHDEMLKEIAELADQGQVSCILLNLPNNPTGQTVEKEFYGKLIELVADRNVTIINDFVYGEMGFSGVEPASILSVASRSAKVIEIYSLSKAYGIPGWRVAAVLGNEIIVDRLAKLKSHIDYGIFLPIQIAAAAALSFQGDLVSSTASEYERRARVLSEGLLKLGWEVTAPVSGACVWAKIPQAGGSDKSGSLSFAIAHEFLSVHGVLTSPGAMFGPDCDNYLRFALVLSTDKLYEVLRRIETSSVTKEWKDYAKHKKAS